MRRLAIAIFAIAGVAMAYLKAYEVTPAKAQWSGWIDTTRDRNFIAQTITGNFDSLVQKGKSSLFLTERRWGRKF